MKHINTPNNAPAANATPAKKQWQKPNFYILDTDNVNSGNIGTDPAEGQKTLNNYGPYAPGSATPNSKNYYHS